MVLVLLFEVGLLVHAAHILGRRRLHISLAMYLKKIDEDLNKTNNSDKYENHIVVVKEPIEACANK